MNLVSSFLQALISEPVLQEHLSPLIFLGQPYSLRNETRQNLLTILSGGTIEAKEKYSFSLHPLACRMLLYTWNGSGTLRLHNKTYPLEKGTLLYFDCSASPFKFDLSGSLWQYTVFFISGELLSHYESFVPFEHALLLPVPSYSAILPGLEKLLHNGTDAALGNKLTDAGALNTILTELWLEAFDLKSQDAKCPPWLLEIRQSLDTFFMNPFKLEDLEEQYHISKYRICREFSAAFGVPPLKYLNRRRIEAAKNLLLSSDKHIHEIASEIGFENTNHFINLFKKETGLTPLVYRNRA